MFTLRKVLIALVVILTLLVGGSWFALKKLVTKESLIAQLESNLSCKATMESFELSAFSVPAALKISKLNLVPSDPTAVNTGITVESLTLKVSLLDLLSRRLTVDQLHISGVYLRDEISKEGKSPLSELFRKPGKKTSTTPPATESPAEVAVATPAPGTAKPATLTAAEVPDDNTASTTTEQSLSFSVKEALLDKTLIHIVDRKARNKRDIHDLRLRVFDVDIDPNNLAAHNTCSVAVSGRTEVIGRKKMGEENVDAQFVNVTFMGAGKIKPFNAETGLPELAAELEVVLAKDSLIGGHLTMGEAAGKDKSIRELQKHLGVDLSGVTIGGVLQKDLTAKFKVEDTRVEWLQDARLEFPDYAILMRKGSWSDSSEDDSRMEIQFMPSAKISQQLIDGITGKYGEGVAKAAKEAFTLPEGGVGFDIILTGPLAKPSVTPSPETVQRAVKAISNNSADLLKGLLGK